nr:conserved hypothetical protein [Albugo laibachii Nc14]|eukprot:CCA16514.1 conserved hypothetical protein [Albugo laibachii Nc14]
MAKEKIKSLKRKYTTTNPVAKQLSAKTTVSPLKNMFKQLDAQSLDTITIAEHNLILSSIRHEQIAIAMEMILSQPSARKKRNRARRLSNLGRLGRRISILPCLHIDNNDRLEKSFCLTQVNTEKSEGIKHKNTMIPAKAIQCVICTTYLSTAELNSVVAFVSREWRNMAMRTIAWRVADYSKYVSRLVPSACGSNKILCSQTRRKNMLELYSSYPRGNYLADGAYKEVYKVFCPKTQSYCIFTIMNISAIRQAGNEHIIQQEVAHSLLISELVRRRWCPNFVEIYEMFLSEEYPRSNFWGSPTDRTQKQANVQSVEEISSPSKNGEGASRIALYQYIQMEYCDGGDLEHFISLQVNQILPFESVVVPFFFQMVFSLFCARERLHLRHCDIKLLNYLLCDINRKGLAKTEGENTSVLYGLEEDHFLLQMPHDFSYWVKLADFGTANSAIENIGQPISIDQFTTLENTPIEYLLGGDRMKQTMKADTFSLGLAYFHLCTGRSDPLVSCVIKFVLHLYDSRAPYEEILADVRCPEQLVRDLKSVWTSGRATSSFKLVRKVIEDDEDMVLYHTLYRFIVLFGLPDVHPSFTHDSPVVWKVLQKHLRPRKTPSARVLRVKKEASQAGTKLSVVEICQQDSQSYSIAHGTNDAIARGRQRLASVPGAMELLREMTDFDPEQRPTLKTVLQGPIFTSLRVDNLSDVAADFTYNAYSNANLAQGCPDV